MTGNHLLRLTVTVIVTVTVTNSLATITTNTSTTTIIIPLFIHYSIFLLLFAAMICSFNSPSPRPNHIQAPSKPLANLKPAWNQVKSDEEIEIKTCELQK